MDDTFDITRRKALAAIGSIGVASAGAGLGTSAYFSDQETFENDQLTAGSLDLKVSWAEHYSDWSEDEAEFAHVEDGSLVIDDRAGFMDATLQEQFPDAETRAAIDAGETDPCGALADVPDDLAKPVIELGDVKPGDFGEVTFDFALCDNPGYLWLDGRLVDESENGLTEPEADDPDEESGVVELADEIQVTVWYDDGDNVLEDPETIVTDREFEPNPISASVAVSGDARIVAQGSLREVLSRLSVGEGIPLDGLPDDAARDCFTDAPTVHYVGFAWELPVDHANEVQSDSVAFDLGFYAEQCRHNDGETDLVAYYPFDGDAADLSGNGHDGTPVNDASFGTGRSGGALVLDGSDDHVEVPDHPALDLTGPYTETAWVNMESTGGRHDVTMKNQPQWALGFQVEDGRLRAGFEDEDDNNYIGVGGTVPTGAWTHLAVVYDGASVTGYVDGSQVFDVQQSSDGTGIPVADATPSTNDEPLLIGRGAGALQGRIDDLRIYSRALSASEIQAIADAP